MQAIKTISDIRIGHVLKFLAALFLSLFVWVCMWFGETAVLLLVVDTFHLHYDAFPSAALNHFAGEFLLTIPTFVGSYPLAALVWTQFYVPKDK